MWLVVGLGNPGAKYERNRHNIGFLAVDAIAEKLGASPWVGKFRGEMCESRVASRDSKVYFLKPQTFMNLSGESVAACARFYKIAPERIIVLHDELDLLPGKLRVKKAGGDGGHNGIRSIDAHLGPDYWRVRIGIGHPGDKNRVSDYVLSDFSKDEWKEQEAMLAAIGKHFSLLLAEDAAGFMNKVAVELSPPSLTLPRKGGEGIERDGKGTILSNRSESLPPLPDSLKSPPHLRGRVREGGQGDLIPLARTLRRNMTDAEKKLWYHLRRENLTGHKFRRQQPLGNYIADFICLEKKLIIEVDGSQHADEATRDVARTAYLEEGGHKVLRFGNNEIIENMEGVLQVIDNALRNR